MHIFTTRHLLAISVVAACTAAHAADTFVPPGAKATLSVDYLYESVGKVKLPSGERTQEWRVKRNASLTAELAAHPATAMPTVAAIDASQMKQLTGKVDKAQAVAKQLAPMQADIMKIMAKCGEDEACISREVEKMGAAMQGTPKLAAAMNAKKGIDEMVKQDAPRYQAWRATAQKGTYLIDESAHISTFDMACPRQSCIRDEVRKGSGAIPVHVGTNARDNQAAAAGISAVELDTNKQTLTVGLPFPLVMLPYTETVVTNESAPKGPQAKQLAFRVGAEGAGGMAKPFTVALKGGFRSQSGEQVMKLKGGYGDEGTLTVRWRFAVQ